ALSFEAMFERGATKGAARRLFVWAGGCVLGLCLSACYFLPAVTTLSLINPSGWDNAGGAHWWDTFAFQIYFRDYAHCLYRLIPSTAYLLFGFTVVMFFWRRKSILYRPEAALLLSTSGTALFLACELSYPVWSVFRPLQYVQRPFRFLPVATIATVIA